MDTDDGIQLTLTADEALVFFAWINRFNESEEQAFEDQAEQRVLWDLEASLEEKLVTPFDENYRALLAAARERVRNPED